MSFDLKIKNGDISIDQDGDFTKIENTAKLIYRNVSIFNF